MGNVWMEKMLCELCGKKDATLKADIEGAVLNVCDACSRFGVVRAKIINSETTTKENLGKLKEIATIESEQLITNYAQVIKHARELTKLSQKEFAAKINERESVIHRLECGEMDPSDVLIRKLEKSLGIR